MGRKTEEQFSKASRKQTSMDPKKIREQANQLYRRGLHIVARLEDAESLEFATGLWRKALKLYRKAGDKSKAAQLQKSLVDLYRDKYVKARGKEEKQSVVKKFKDWFIFFKIGCFGFGGPMAVFTLLQDVLVHEKQILTDKDFLEGAVLGDVLPGPVTMDIVTYTGYKLKKWYGAFIATLVFILPSFIIMIILAMLYDKYSITPKVTGVLRCLGAAVTGLILSVALKLSKAELKDYRELCVLLWAFASSLIFNLDIVLIVGLSGLVGIVLYHDDPQELLSE